MYNSFELILKILSIILICLFLYFNLKIYYRKKGDTAKKRKVITPILSSPQGNVRGVIPEATEDTTPNTWCVNLSKKSESQPLGKFSPNNFKEDKYAEKERHYPIYTDKLLLGYVRYEEKNDSFYFCSTNTISADEKGEEPCGNCVLLTDNLTVYISGKSVTFENTTPPLSKLTEEENND